MHVADVRWERLFPYEDSKVLISRLDHRWRVRMGGRCAEAATLIEAFEHVRGRAVTDDDLRIVLRAMSFDMDINAARVL